MHSGGTAEGIRKLTKSIFLWADLHYITPLRPRAGFGSVSVKHCKINLLRCGHRAASISMQNCTASAITAMNGERAKLSNLETLPEIHLHTNYIIILGRHRGWLVTLFADLLRFPAPVRLNY